MKLAFAHSEAGKGIAYVLKVAMDLVKARRENGNSDKVWMENLYLFACMYVSSLFAYKLWATDTGLNWQ